MNTLTSCVWPVSTTDLEMFSKRTCTFVIETLRFPTMVATSDETHVLEAAGWHRTNAEVSLMFQAQTIMEYAQYHEVH